MARTLFGKTRTAANPYAIYTLGEPENLWTHNVLKTYKNVKSELGDPFTRWFCAVSSPYIQGNELGDVYRRDVLRGSRLTAATPEWLLAYVASITLETILDDWAANNGIEVLD